LHKVARMEDCRSAFNIFTPAGRRPLGKPRRRWKDNIRMDLKVTDFNMRNWFDSAQDKEFWRALVNTGLNLRVPLTIK